MLGPSKVALPRREHITVLDLWPPIVGLLLGSEACFLTILNTSDLSAVDFIFSSQVIIQTAKYHYQVDEKIGQIEI